MAQKRRGAKEEQVKLERITLMIPADLKAELDSEVETGVRTFSDVVRQRLKETRERGAWAEVEPTLASHPRAFGRLMGFLANELVSYSPPGEESTYLQHGIARMLERLSGKALSGPESEAAMMADYWWLRMNNAHERVYEQGAPAPLTSEQRALAEIRSEVVTRPVAGAVERSQKGRSDGEES